MSVLLRLSLVVILALFFSVGQSSNVDTTLAGAQVCKTTSTQSCSTCCSQYQCGQNCTQSCTCGVQICGPGCLSAVGVYCCNSCAITSCTCTCTTTCTPVYCTSCGTCCNTVNSTTCQSLPDAPTLISPANGATSFSSTWTLSWNAVDPDNTPTTPMYFEVSVQPSGSGSFTNICNFNSGTVCPRASNGQTVSVNYTATTIGTYTWRVRAWDGWTDQSGNPVYSAYSATRTFGYNNISPDAPTLIDPLNGGYAIGQATLQWRGNDPDSGPNAYIDYELSVRSSDGQYISGFSFFTGHTGTNGQVLNYVLTPQREGLYYWKVRARDGWTDGAGNQIYSAYSEERSIFIEYDCP